MGKIKDAIIKKMGGYTEAEWFRCVSVQERLFRNTKALDLCTMRATMRMDRFEWEHFDNMTRERIVKSQIKRILVDQLDPFVEYTVRELEPPYNCMIVMAKLQAMRPETGGMFKMEHQSNEQFE